MPKQYIFLSLCVVVCFFFLSFPICVWKFSVLVVVVILLLLLLLLLLLPSNTHIGWSVCVCVSLCVSSEWMRENVLSCGMCAQGEHMCDVYYYLDDASAPVLLLCSLRWHRINVFVTLSVCIGSLFLLIFFRTAELHSIQATSNHMSLYSWDMFSFNFHQYTRTSMHTATHLARITCFFWMYAPLKCCV